MLLSRPAAADPVPLPTERALPRADFTGDGQGDISFRKSNGSFHVADPAGTFGPYGCATTANSPRVGRHRLPAAAAPARTS
ncbi:hypothetical protein ACF08N_26815 [Streptomyces sp. NPDC015127]|uniref:hypothetical protein n=1 Tax=Streptomyces sp. NPDC015127 TaxID=3364939 RepID=UPI0036F9042F